MRSRRQNRWSPRSSNRSMRSATCRRRLRSTRQREIHENENANCHLLRVLARVQVTSEVREHLGDKARGGPFVIAVGELHVDPRVEDLRRDDPAHGELLGTAFHLGRQLVNGYRELAIAVVLVLGVSRADGDPEAAGICSSDLRLKRVASLCHDVVPFSAPADSSLWRRRSESFLRAPQKPISSCSRAAARRRRAISAYSGFISQPANRRPSRKAATPVLPEPVNGSRISSPWSEKSRTNRSINARGFWV